MKGERGEGTALGIAHEREAGGGWKAHFMQGIASIFLIHCYRSQWFWFQVLCFVQLHYVLKTGKVPPNVFCIGRSMEWVENAGHSWRTRHPLERMSIPGKPNVPVLMGMLKNHGSHLQRIDFSSLPTSRASPIICGAQGSKRRQGSFSALKGKELQAALPQSSRIWNGFSHNVS